MAATPPSREEARVAKPYTHIRFVVDFNGLLVRIDGFMCFCADLIGEKSITRQSHNIEIRTNRVSERKINATTRMPC
jgi:hypothetical protein